MAWTGKVINNMGDAIYTEDIAGPNSTTYAYTSDINALAPGIDPSGHRYVSIRVEKISGTLVGANIDTVLRGSFTGLTADAYNLLDAPGSIADLNTTTTTAANSAPFDLAAYPSPYRYLSLLGDTGDDTDCVLRFYLFVPKI